MPSERATPDGPDAPPPANAREGAGRVGEATHRDGARPKRHPAERLERAADLLAACLALEPPLRAASLAEATAGDPELHDLVAQLLHVAELEGTFLDDARPGERAREVVEALADSVARPSGDHEADRVAGYEIVSELGAGGFGTVWLARQLEPVRRDVALKVLKPGMDTRDIVARFEHERQALARMSHENVARVLDAGLTESGRPFFAMELVRGRPITRHCDAERLDVRARLRLFVEACRGVQHAHQRGLIHRDIKPSNVMVTDDDHRAVPKVIDFGIAKAIEGDPEERQVRTQRDEVLGTPAYMSPEQATAGAAVDTRTDVYSLGVLLYELLTGQLPLDGPSQAGASAASMQDALRHVEPPRPSDRLRFTGSRMTGRSRGASTPAAPSPDDGAFGERLRQIARARGTEPGPLRRELRGDLDWIVMTAMAKEPSRRYPTVDALVADVERYLSDAPVEARPPSATYRLRKLARRHRVAAIAAVVSLALLVAGLLGTSYGRAAANQARRVAEARRARAEEQVYRGSMLFAEQAIVARRLEPARALLDEAPKELRGWEWSHLAGRLDPRVSVLLPPGTTIDRLVVDRRDPGRVWSWDRKLLQSWDDEADGPATSLELDALGPDRWFWRAIDGTIVSLHQDGRMIRIDASGDVADLPPIPGPVYCACFDAALEQVYWFEPGIAPSSRSVAGTTVRRGRSPVPMGALADCGITPDGARLFVALHRDLFVLDAATLDTTQATSLQGNRELSQVAVSPDGSLLAMGYGDGSLDLDEVGTCGLTIRATLPGASAWIASLAWSGDGRRLAAGCGDGSTRVWDAGSGRLLDTLALAGDPVGQVAFLGERLLVAPWARGLVSWQPGADDHRRLRGHVSYVYDVAVLGDGELAVSAGWEARAGMPGGLKVWDLRSRELVATWGDEKGILQDVEPTTDGSRLLVAAQVFPGSWVKVLDVRTGQVARTFELAEAVIVELAALDARRAIAMEGGGGRDDEDRALLLDLDDGTTRELPDSGLTRGFSEADRAAAVSRDGRWLALSWGRGGIQVRDAHTLAVLARRVAHDASSWSLAFSPDGESVASASDDGTVATWSVPSLELRHRLRGSGSPLMCAAWSPDGSRLATGARDGAIELWDPARALLVARLTGHASYVKSLVWTPDGTTLLSASGDSDVRVWDVASAADVAAAAAERDLLLARLAPEVDARLAATGDAAGVARWIEQDAGMTARERQVAGQELLRRGLEGTK